MGFETEIKLRVRDVHGMRQKLREARAKHIATARQHDAIYDYHDSRLRKKGELVRLRVIVPIWPDRKRQAFLAFKGKKREKGAVKTRVEQEFEVKDLGGAMEVLHELGLEKKIEYLKFTEFYKLGKVKITLDHFPHYRQMGFFIELEANAKEIRDAMKRLDLSNVNAVKQTYPELVAYQQLFSK